MSSAITHVEDNLEDVREFVHLIPRMVNLTSSSTHRPMDHTVLENLPRLEDLTYGSVDNEFGVPILSRMSSLRSLRIEDSQFVDQFPTLPLLSSLTIESISEGPFEFTMDGNLLGRLIGLRHLHLSETVLSLQFPL